MPTYSVLEAVFINGQIYYSGQTVDLTGGVASAFLSLGKIKAQGGGSVPSPAPAFGYAVGTINYYLGTQPPVDGTYKKGDRVINTNPSDGSFDGWVCTVAGSPGTWIGYGAIGGSSGSGSSAPVPTIAIASSVPGYGVINAAIALTATAGITGGTVTTQFKVNGTNQGSPATGSTPSTSWTPTAKGTYSVTAAATGALGGAATSAAKSILIYDTKVSGGGSGAGTSLGAIANDYILFDNNQSAGGNAATMNVFVGGTQVAAFNYGDTAYNGKPFTYFNSANSTFYTGTIAATVNF